MRVHVAFATLALLFSMSATASGYNCRDLFDPALKSVRTEYAKLISASRKTPKVANQHGIESSEFIKEMVRISYLTGVDPKTIANQAHQILAIKSKPGIPDGDELTLKTVSEILTLANAAKVDPKTVFDTTVAFLPLAEGRVGDEGSLLELVKMSVIYKKSPQQVVDVLDKISAASKPLNEKVGRHMEARLAEMDELSRALAQLSGAATQGIGSEISLAMIESALVTNKPISQVIAGVDEILENSVAMGYTIHEKAAMLKALLIHGQTITTSLSYLKELETGAQSLFGANLIEAVERPAVNLILLAQVSPQATLNLLSRVNTTGQRYSQNAMVMVLNKILIKNAGTGAGREMILSSALRIQED